MLRRSHTEPAFTGKSVHAKENGSYCCAVRGIVEFLLMFQAALGSADAPHDVYVTRGADLVGEPEIDEAQAARWVPVDEAQEMIRR